MARLLPVIPKTEPTPTAIRRLQRDLQNLVNEPIDGIRALPLEENILEWHYVLEGTKDTPYEGGFYHGRLIFQPDFPWKPPAIYMDTPSGRFQCNTRLCLSISDYHPETWNPGWTVSAILVGLHSFMNDNQVASGCLDSTPEMKQVLAAKSKAFNLGSTVFCKVFPSLAAEFLTAGISAMTETERRIATARRPVPEELYRDNEFIRNNFPLADIDRIAPQIFEFPAAPYLDDFVAAFAGDLGAGAGAHVAPAANPLDGPVPFADLEAVQQMLGIDDDDVPMNAAAELAQLEARQAMVPEAAPYGGFGGFEQPQPQPQAQPQPQPQWHPDQAPRWVAYPPEAFEEVQPIRKRGNPYDGGNPDIPPKRHGEQ